MSELLTKREKIHALKKRGVELKSKLKAKRGWKSAFCKEYKDYDTNYWSKFIDNMLAGITTDEELLVLLEKYADSEDLFDKQTSSLNKELKTGIKKRGE